jgi:hypothetical protein
MSKLFVSYNHKSAEAATGLMGDLEALGHVVWLDNELSGGQAWWDQILAHIRDCDVFVLLLDPHSLSSTACQRESGYAGLLEKPILPVLVADGVSPNLLPPELARLHYIDYRKQDRAAALGLARALGAIPVGKPLPSPLPAPPEVPISYLGTLGRKVDSGSALNYDEQSALVLDLGRGLRERENADDARVLLRRLRKRRDLFVAVAEEIDALLGPAQSVHSVPRDREPVSLPPDAHSGQAAHSTTEESAALLPVSRPLLSTRPRLAAAGGCVGALMGALVLLLGPTKGASGELWIAALIGGTALALIAGIAGRDRRAVIGASIGATVGFIAWASLDTGTWGLGRAVLFGASIGGVLGSIIGVGLTRLGPRRGR